MATTINPQHTQESNENNALTQLFNIPVALNWVLIAYVIIFVLAVFTRFYMLGERTMSHDESLHTVYSNNLYKDGFFEHTPLMHGPILFHFTALSYALFGVNDFTARIYAAVVGVMIVMFPIFFRRWLGRTGSVLASIMLLLSPLLVYYSRYIRHDMPSIFSGMLLFYSAMMYISGPENQRRRAHWLYLIAVAMIWNLGSKETAFIYIAIFGAFLTLYWLTRVAQTLFQVDGKIVFYTIVTSISMAFVMTLGMIVVVSISLSKQILPQIGGSLLDDVTLSDRLQYVGEQAGLLFSGDAGLDFLSFLSWSGLVLVFMLAVLIGTALWAYRSEKVQFSILDPVMLVLAVLIGAAVSTLLGNEVTTILESGLEQTVNYSGAALGVGLIVTISLLLVYGAVRIELVRNFGRQFVIVFALMLAVTSILLFFEERSHHSSRAEDVAAPAVPGEDGGEIVEVESDFTVLPLVFIWVAGAGIIGALVFAKQRGLFVFLYQFPEFDVLIVMGSLILPWLTAVFIVSTRGSPEDFIAIGEDLGNLIQALPVNSPQQAGEFVVGFLAWVPMMAISIVSGVLWNWRRWLVTSAIFHIIFAFFFTTVFTNIQGLASGMVYSLQYWLEQQGVRRGSQPQYYYLSVIMPFYEFLPIIGSFLAMIAGMVFFWRKQREYDEDVMALTTTTSGESTSKEVDDNEIAEAYIDEAEARAKVRSKWQLTEVPFLLFVGWWAVLNLFGYTLAGEKMPWLGTHMTVPMILLSAWFFGRIIERIDARKFAERGWVNLILLPLLFIALFQVIAPYFGGRPPFQGTTSTQLEWTYNWLAAVVVAGVIIYGVYRITEFTGFAFLRRTIVLSLFVVLAFLTFRSTWLSSFIHYDEATEFLVYAHGGPANKSITEDLRDLSLRITNGLDLRVVHDDKFTWPGSWYLRDFTSRVYNPKANLSVQELDDTVAVIVSDVNRPNAEPALEGAYQRFDYTRMWWPIQDYFDLNATRINGFFDFSNATAGNVRRGLFDIWWSRDYSTYAAAKNKEITLTEWPVRDDMSLYIRKDYIAQVWPYGLGEGDPSSVFTTVEVNECAANWEQRIASVVFDTSIQSLQVPVGIDVSLDGRVFVAEDGGHEVTVFSSDGRFLNAFGQRGTVGQDGAFFERPHSVAVAPDGRIYVADTWNYQVRAFTTSLNPITRWGQPQTGGLDAQTQPFDGFWGPRDIAVGADGLVYVSDTGNKRVRVYSQDGVWQRDIGSGGKGDGQLDEPAGIAVHSDGRLFVADTWNRRIAVFSTVDGSFIQNFSVRGWYDDVGNRPYIALDEARNLLYVTDPDAGRILIYDTQGNCVSSFGQLNQDAPSDSEFSTLSGIAVDADGNTYIVDMGSGRILRFDPYIVPETLIIDPEVSEDLGSGGAIDAIAGEGENEQPQFPPGVDPESTPPVFVPQLDQEDLDNTSEVGESG